MALSHLLKFVYNNGTDEVIRRGKKIHAIGYVEFVEHDDLMGTVTFRVKDDNYSTFYKVTIQKYKDPRTMALRCSCPYNLGDICRHEAAALLQLQELLDKNILGDRSIVYHQRHTVVKMKNLDLKSIRYLTSPESYEDSEKYLRTQKANIILAKEERVEAKLEIDGDVFPVVIQKNEERNFDTSCKCTDEHHPLCVHKSIVFLQLLNAYGPFYFDSIRNWEKEKNKLLEAYGYSMNDAGWEKKFEFTYKDGKPFLRVLDPKVRRVEMPVASLRPKPEIQQREEVIPEPDVEIVPDDSKLGVVFNTHHRQFPGFSIDVITGELSSTGNSFAGKVVKLDLGKFIPTETLNEEDTNLLQSLRKFHASEINKYVSRNSPFSGIWENIIHTEEDGLPADTESLISEYFYPKLKKLFTEQKDKTLFFKLPPGKSFTTAHLEPVDISTSTMVPSFLVEIVNNKYRVTCFAVVNELDIELTDNEWQSDLLVMYNNCLYLWEKERLCSGARIFSE